MTQQYRDVQELPKDSFFIQFQDNLVDLNKELTNYLKRNRSKFSRNQLIDVKRIRILITKANAISQAIIDSVRSPNFVDDIDELDENIPF